MPCINSEINPILTCSENCAVSEENRATTFLITDKNFENLCFRCNFINSR